MSSRMLGNDVGSIPKQVSHKKGQAVDGLAKAANTRQLRSIKLGQSEGVARFNYREKVRRFAEQWPQADLLVSYLDQDWENPNSVIRTTYPNIIITDLSDAGETTTVEVGISHLKNEAYLHDTLTQAAENVQLRLIIASDLSPTVVSHLGSSFDLNPFVFVEALQDIWGSPDLQVERMGSLSLEKNFGSSLFSYDSETACSSSLLFYSGEMLFNDLHISLSSPEVTNAIDAAVIGQDCKNKAGSRILSPIHPILCPPIRKGSVGTAEVFRSYESLNRLTLLEISNTEIPVFIMLTTSSNDWTEKDQHLAEAARQKNTLPHWAEQLTNRIQNLRKTSIINIQIRDKGNVFFSRFIGYGSSPSHWWDSEASQSGSSNKRATLAAYYTRDILPLLFKCKSRTHIMFALDVWATKRAIEAFEDTLSRARERLDWFKANATLYKSIPITGRIQILRDHRHILASSKERIETHIQKFRVSSSCAMQPRDRQNAQYQDEVKELLHRLQKTGCGMESVIFTNEQLIQDCLFDLQLDLANTPLLESRRSIEQNAAVKRLTALAFVFIPISTVSAVFSVNFQGTQDVAVWIFLVVTAFVLCLSLVLVGYRSVKALLSATEAIAFEFSNWPGPDFGIRNSLEPSTVKHRSHPFTGHSHGVVV